MFRRVISIILTLVLALGILPMGLALAADATYSDGNQNRLQAVLNQAAASGGGTVTITRSFELSAQITIPSGVILVIADTTNTVFVLQSNKGGHITIEANAGLIISSKINVNNGGDNYGFTIRGFAAITGSTSELVQGNDKWITALEVVETDFLIIYNVNGGDIETTPGVTEKTLNQTAYITEDVPTRLGYRFVTWNTKSDGTGLDYEAGDAYTDNKTITLYAQWEEDYEQTRKLSYTVDYFIDGQYEETVTVIEEVWVLDPATTLTVQPVDVADDRYEGYMFDSTDPEVIPEEIIDGGIIKVFYVRDDSQKRDVTYTVMYTRNGVEVAGDTYTETVQIWINEPDDFAVDVAEISAENDRYVGYELEVNPFVAPATAINGQVITVPYIKDDLQTRNVTYTVRYTRDGAEVVADTYTVTVPVWINDPADVTVPVAAISAANNRYVGYKLATNPFAAPATAQNGDEITVPYIMDDSQTRDVTYTVMYTCDGVEVEDDTYTVTVPVWINAPADVAVPVAAISAANNRYGGYKLATNPFVAPETAEDGDVITVPYITDASQTRDVTYTVRYTIDGVEVDDDTYTVTVPVWINAPADTAVPVAEISAENDRYVGYMLEEEPFIAPETAQNNDVITVPYVMDESQTRDVVYTVKYTIEGTEVIADTYTVTVPVWINAPAGIAVPVAEISAENDRYIGYMLGVNPFVSPETAQDGDVITVPYIRDNSQTRDVTYTVEYTLDGVVVADDTYTVTVPVWINEPADVAVPVAAISAENDRYVGYMLEDDPFEAPETALNGDVITVPYVKDESQTRELIYTVRYTTDGEEVEDDTYTVIAEIWINEPDDFAVDVAAISAENDRYVGYMLAVDPFEAPETAKHDDVITVPYIKDDDWTKELSYTVRYTRDDVEVTADTYTVTVPVWINEPDGFAVPVATISAANDRYVGYKLEINPFVAPETAINGQVITVPYIKDDDWTKELSYTVRYTRDDVEVTADTYTVTVPVWINEPDDFAVDVADISAANDRYVGYKLAVNPFAAPATAQDGDVITVPYIRDDDWTKELSYTINYYIDGEFEESESVTETVWVNDPDTLVVQLIDHNKYLPSHGFDKTDPSELPETIADGGEIDAYYKRIIFIVTYEPGKEGLFEAEIYVDRPYDSATPPFNGDLNDCNIGWVFDGWAPMLADTVTEDATYVAQWKQIPYTITFLLGDNKMGETLDGQAIYLDMHYGDAMPTPPHPYAKFSYKFTGWLGNDGSFIAAPDYTKPTELVGYPLTVSGDVTYTAQWGVVNPGIVFPDKIPSLAHFDRWWGDYGIICYAASTTKDDMYTVMFADWFFDVYKSATIGYGSPGKMDYEIRFYEDGTELWNMNSGKQITNKGEIEYRYDMTCIMDGQYFTKAKNHNYGLDFGGTGTLQGVSFINPFGSGAKLAWLY